MKRFYTEAAAVPQDEGFGIALDGRPVRTPGRALLTAPTLALAERIAREWAEQGEKIEPRAMRFTGLANAAIRSEEHTSELQSLMRISYAVFCLKNKTTQHSA